MKTQIQDGNLIITIPLTEPTRSASGKTLIIASTSGPKKSGAQFDGKEVTVNLNVWIKP